MLDNDTKRRIDTARDILVGKVPDPKSQVEQITIALIYKFMDDMDAEAEELGGKRKFFAGDYARYGWAKLMRSGLGGHELLGLYAEGISKMPENPGIPLLFRDIFKNAFLPYRDPETLKAFLKIIDEFTYDHSERLGDAFEYLLSVLGSQGDAGQFRTPRHIIDFIVSIVNPTKKDTVLDPACGTAGFLISSYKHILKANMDPNGQLKLTPDEKGQLAKNFKGYDISPDMVRLSLVNLYLHGFTDPHIYEYDTLTSEERWNEYADVILANPPFMSPKGGIKPHKRFSIQAKRSEVLFVDYMAEHLTPKGRAGIIVPEGIIFQSQGAYTELRKMLVENSLVVVISLPAGVFNPYSGVKTSILILDKSLAKEASSIAFFKIENDGFGLGAQRREIEKNDLPQARVEILEYLRRLRAHESLEGFQPTLGLVVSKEKIAASGDYNLSGERYRENGKKSSRYTLVPIGEICELINGRAFTPQDWESASSGGLPIIRIQNLNSSDSDFNYYTGEVTDRHVINHGELLFSWSGSRGTSFGAHIWKGPRAVLNQHIFKVGFDESRASKMYLLYALNKAVAEIEENLHGGVGLVHITKGNLEKIKIPLPPLYVQKEIVADIERNQKIIDGALSVVDNYRPHIPIHPDWPMVEVGELVTPQYGFTASAADEGDARFIRITDISSDGRLRSEEAKFVKLTGEARQLLLAPGDILVARTGATYGKTMLFSEEYPAVFASYLIRLRLPANRILPRYYWVFAQSDSYWAQANSLMTGGGQPQFNGNAIKRIKVPLPPLATQEAIVTEIETEQALVKANRELVARFEKKVQSTLTRIWGENVPVQAEG
jgi:type I restriction enzyme M protein